jgi:hypothetical protein
MRVNFAHLSHPSTSGGLINFAVFEGRSQSGLQADNDSVLAKLTIAARSQGLRVDQSALVFNDNGRIRYYGAKSLVQFLSGGVVPSWTHYLDI